MSYFTLRFRLQLIICVWMLISYSLIIFVIPTIHSSKSAHNLLQQTSDILQEMNYNKTVRFNRIKDIDKFKAKSRQIYEFDQDGIEDEDVENIIKLSLKDKSIIEMISLTGFENNERNKTSITSIFQPLSFLKYYWHNIDYDQRTTTSAFGSSKPRSLSWLPANHLFESTCSFLCYILVNNLYVLACAYFYWPVVKHEPQIPCKYLSTSQSEARQTDLREIEDESPK